MLGVLRDDISAAEEERILKRVVDTVYPAERDVDDVDWVLRKGEHPRRERVDGSLDIEEAGWWL